MVTLEKGPALTEESDDIVFVNALSSRTQVVIGISVAAVIGGPIIAYGFKTSTLASVGVAFVALAFMAGFRQMTVRVNRINLQVVFAYGWPRRTVQVSEVVDVSSIACERSTAGESALSRTESVESRWPSRSKT